MILTLQLSRMPITLTLYSKHQKRALHKANDGSGAAQASSKTKRWADDREYIQNPKRLTITKVTNSIASTSLLLIEND